MRKLIIVAMFFILSGCMVTTYTPVNSVQLEKKQSALFSQDVIYRISDDLYKEAPNCVIIWPTQDPKMPKIEAAVARYASERFVRVIGPKLRERNVRKWAFDLRSHADRQTFSRKVKCPFGINISTAQRNRDYFVVWSQQRLILTLDLKSMGQKKTLWSAHHSAKRSGGGIPLSPISFAINAAEAGLHQNDNDVAASLIDDAVRRMIVTLPDLR